MKMKKVLSVCLSMIMTATMLASCGKNSSDDTSSKPAETMKAEEVGVDADKYKNSSATEETSSESDESSKSDESDNTNEDSESEEVENQTIDSFPFSEDLTKEEQSQVYKKDFNGTQQTRTDESINLSSFKVAYNGKTYNFDIQKLKLKDFFDKTGLYTASIVDASIDLYDDDNESLEKDLKNYLVSEDEAHDLYAEFSPQNKDGFPFYCDVPNVVDDKNTLMDYKTSGFGITSVLLRKGKADTLIINSVEMIDTNKNHFDDNFLDKSKFDYEEYGMENPTVEVEFCEGIKVGTSKKEVEEKLGKFNPDNSKYLKENAEYLAQRSTNKAIEDVAIYYNSKAEIIIYYYKEKVCGIHLESNFDVRRVDKMYQNAN